MAGTCEPVRSASTPGSSPPRSPRNGPSFQSITGTARLADRRQLRRPGRAQGALRAARGSREVPPMRRHGLHPGEAPGRPGFARSPRPAPPGRRWRRVRRCRERSVAVPSEPSHPPVTAGQPGQPLTYVLNQQLLSLTGDLWIEDGQGNKRSKSTASSSACAARTSSRTSTARSCTRSRSRSPPTSTRPSRSRRAARPSRPSRRRSSTWAATSSRSASPVAWS